MGASSLTVAVEQALPKPPDIPVEGAVPGGRLLPCVPEAPAGQPLVGRSGYRLQFQVGQGYQLTLRRIHVQLPVYVEERELEKQTFEETQTVHYGSKTERDAEATLKAAETGEEKKTIGYATPYERRAWVVACTPEGEKQLKVAKGGQIERSVLPLTVTVVARLVTPDGPAWTESYEVPINYLAGNPGSAKGGGLIDSYADLMNPIAIDPTKQNYLQLLLFIPSAVATNTQLGPEQTAAGPVLGEGAVTFFYDIDPAPVGK